MVNFRCLFSEKGSCDQCTGGYYCVQNTSDPNSFPCPVGHYCPPGTQYDTQYKCSAGTYNPLTTQSSAAACKLCDAGKYCFGEGLSAPTGNCSQGWFCTGGASETKPLLLGKVLRSHKSLTHTHNDFDYGLMQSVLIYYVMCINQCIL